MDVAEESVTVTFRLPATVLDEIDAIRMQSEFHPTRSAAIRSLVEDGIAARRQARRGVPRTRIRLAE